MRVNYFQTPKIQAVLICEGNDIARGSIRDCGWGQYRNIKWSINTGVIKTIESQRSNLGSWWNLQVLTTF